MGVIRGRDRNLPPYPPIGFTQLAQLLIRFHGSFLNKRVAAGGAGDEKEAFTDIGHAAEIKAGAGLLARRAGQSGQPISRVRIDLIDGARG